MVPCIETPKDTDDLYMPIGQIIARRIKFNVKELNVVNLTKSKDEKKNQVKKLIKKMTVSLHMIVCWLLKFWSILND